MADTLPVCEALREAIDYLSRLGSNLRVRSENFKQKKLGKDRLRNTHAVQKAANKVLLICELSKKSILNVEDGVKQILTQIDSSQGSNRLVKNESTKNIAYEYFEYDSQTLKIRNKINLEHFTSVKVVTEAMPASMQDNYPLYYVCNLYHIREKRDKQKCDEYELTDIEMLNNSNDEDPSSKRRLSSIKSSKKSDANINNCKVADKSNNLGKSDSTPTYKKGHAENTEIMKKSPLTKQKKYKHIKLVDDDSSESNCNVDSLQTDKTIIVPIDGAEKTESVDASSTNKKINMEEKNTQETNNVDTSDDVPVHVSIEENTSKCSSARNSQVTNLNAEDVFLDTTEKMDTDMIDTNEINKDQILTHSDKETNDSKIDISNINTDAEKYTNTSLLNDLCTVSNDVSNTNADIESNSETKSIPDDNSRCSTESKPLIKCVNINKLLKKDIISKARESVIEIIDSDTDDEITVKNKKHRHHKKYKSKSKTKLSQNFFNKDSNTHKDSNPHINYEEDFWKKKVKELKEFSPKQFSVNIFRMPKLTEQFLYKYNLNRIIQNGSVVCENGGTGLKRYKSNEKNRTIDLKNSENTSIKEVSVVKSSLLSDSESDCERETGKCNELKKALLSESDTLEQQEKAKSEESGNDTYCDKSVNKEVQMRVIPSGQDSQSNIDSSDTNTKCRKRKRKSKNSSSPLASKRKRIMKSTHAKNILLNCSSSSDTEDEEVKDVLKNIKDSLLKGESDEDIEIKQKSGSDGELIKSNQNQSNSECEMSTKDTNSQENTEVNSDSISEIVTNNIKNIEKAKSIRSEDDKNSEKSINKDRRKKKREKPSEQESEHHNDSSKYPLLSKRKLRRKKKQAKKKLLNFSSSSGIEDEGFSNALRNIKDSLLKGESDDNMEKKSGSDGEVTKSNTSLRSQRKSNSECDISTKGTSSQGNEVDTNSSSEKMGRSKSKPDGSSSQSSDTQESYDKDIDRLTNLNTLIKKRRLRRQRRRSTASDHSQSTSSNSVNKMPKAPLISEDGFLKAESSSDAASLADSDVGEEVEIPAVSMSGLNGDSIDHLAKADLLEETNSSDSHEKSSNDIKKEDESEEDNVKSKRRKANAISSDSEAGGSRRKNRGGKLSDFEDSDDDSEPTKKSKRKKKKNNDSDASVSSSIDGSKKKRRRIKHVDDSDDASGSESETEGRNKHGRKNIRKVMGKNQLEEATKKAAREEKERIARIAERQKLYNNLQFDESGKPDEVVLDKVVLDFDPETKEPLIEVDKGLVKKLKPHQANGIKFMWDACFESVKRIKKDKGSGCILAHCMGLGKTLQVVSLTHTLLTHASLTGVRRVLVVCPLSTVLNWVNEFGIWLKHSHTDYEVDVYELSRHKQNSERAWQLQQWFSGGGVCVLGYEMFRNLSADNSKKFKKKMLKSFQESLVDPGPDLVVCDEGHLLKNEKTSLSQAMNRVKTLRRIVLTGTPLQNNLKEYYCMVQFVKPNLLGKYNEYLNRFVNPITNGQYTDSTEHDIRVMKRRSHVLHKMLDGAVQRRDYGVLAPFLPPKHEYVLFITLSEVQIKLYEHYLDNYSRRPLPGKSSGFLFPDFQSLQRIWTHPLVLKYNSERYEIMQQKKREREEEDSEGSIADFIDDDSTPDESSTEESTDSLSDMSDDSRKKNKKKKSTKKSKGKDTKITTRRGTRANPIEVDDDDVILEEDVQVKSENPTEWWMSLVTEDELDDLRHSHKLVLLFDILRQCETIGDKLLVFSQSLYSLDLIEHFLGKVDEATQEARVDEKLNGHVGSWSPGVDYFRLDGSTSCENRSIWCKNFNREDNPRARLFLISTRAGGLGINLVAANRVVIFDVSWNPSHDVQSIFRVYRFGQKKPCYIYRFLAMGTMEEKIYERQVTKQAISKRVIDEQQIDRHYAENDLAELYKFEPRPPVPRELPPLPKDRLFAEMLREHEAQIYKYHEHDSLLENKEEETLTEEERKAAWEDFENEKTRPPPAPFSAYMHNGMMPGLLQQQQQLAYATFAALLHKEMPNASDAQIREALYRSNPAMFGGYDYGLLQKMGELYKYAQPGMMNPAMMNPAMNAAGGMALGGSSGLQYEPPWQRQQQMRMQQLLQQNQQMGAKFYAGGLGSRDPVAMALQQQRAREMMLGERGRARGRPRHDAAPPVAISPTDVVNLDSD